MNNVKRSRKGEIIQRLLEKLLETLQSEERGLYADVSWRHELVDLNECLLFSDRVTLG